MNVCLLQSLHHEWEEGSSCTSIHCILYTVAAADPLATGSPHVGSSSAPVLRSIASPDHHVIGKVPDLILRFLIDILPQG